MTSITVCRWAHTLAVARVKWYLKGDENSYLQSLSHASLGVVGVRSQRIARKLVGDELDDVRAFPEARTSSARNGKETTLLTKRPLVRTPQ